MINPTHGQPVVEADDIVERIDALIPRDATGTPLAWANRQVPFRTLFDARNEIQGLRSQLDATYVAARVRMLEEALAQEQSLRARLAENNERLRARVAVLETALRHYADDAYNGYNGNGNCARAALEAKP
jgi:hypothetical protein